MKLIVVGNGILSCPQGHLIDKFDTVIRLSSHKTAGYECLVGSKTDIHAVGRIEEAAPGARIWFANPLGFSDTPQRAIDDAYPNGHIDNSQENMDTTYKACGMEKGQHPTLGLLTIFMAINFGKYYYDLPITITGFDFGHAGWPTYYYDKTARPADKLPYDHHANAKERKVVKMLIDQGWVKYLVPGEMYALEEMAHPRICRCQQ